MAAHLMNAHKRGSGKENYVDRSLEYEEEIKAVITRCFGQSEASIDKMPKKERLR